MVVVLRPGLEGDDDEGVVKESISIGSRIGDIAVGGGGVTDCRCVEVAESSRVTAFVGSIGSRVCSSSEKSN